MPIPLPADRAAPAQPLTEQAFQILYDATSGPVLAYLIAGCGRRDVAEDLLQETFCRLLLRWPSLAWLHTDPPALRRYLFRIATNLLHDRRRSGAGEPFAEPPEEGLTPNIDVTVDIRAMLRRLRPRERQLLWLAYVEDMDHAEIAASTGLSRLSVRTLLFRARARARQFLSQEGVTP